MIGAIAGAAIGGLLSAKGARDAAKIQAGSANQQIAMQREMQRRAAEAAKFRPVGVTSPYGTADIQVRDGQLQSVGFNLSPEMQARADRFAQLGEGMLGQLTTDPTQAAQERTQRLEALAQPGRELAQERLFSNLASKGLTGIGVDMGMGGAVNPYMLAQSQAEERQRALTSAESYDLARRQMQEDFAQTQRLFGAQQGIFDIGQAELGTALDIADIERQRAISAATGQAQFGQNISDIMSAQANARAQQQAALYGGIGQAVSGMDLSGLFGGLSSAAGSAPAFSGQRYGTNFGSEQSRMLAAQDFGLY